MGNSLVQNNAKTIGDYLGKINIKTYINGILGNEKEGQKFISSIMSAVSVNPKLQECEYSSIISSALLANALNLSLSPTIGLCYIIPFKNNKAGTSTATFVLGYKGYIQLAIRSGYYKKLTVEAIKEGELVRYDAIHEEIEVNLIEDEELRESTPTIGYYAMFKHVNGFEKVIYWSIQKMQIHANKYSKAYSLDADTKLKSGEIPQDQMWKYSSFWYTDFDGMAKKTMIRQLISKWGIMSIDMQNAVENDADFIKNDTHFFGDGVPPIQPTEPIITPDEPQAQPQQEKSTTEEFDLFG